MSSHQGTSFNQQLYDEAASWLVEFRCGDIDATGRADFYRWLQTSPEHMRAYLELAAIWNEGSALDRAQHMSDLALLEQSQPETNVIPFSASDPERSNEPQDASRSVRRPARGGTAKRNLLTFAAAALLAAVGVFQWYWHEVRGVYTTAVGEQHLITLGDGSAIEMNAQSKIRVRYTAKQRELELLRGEALFSVAHDASRPFVVQTADTRVRALGTRFDVYRKPAETTVTVIQGTVAVMPTLARPQDESADSARLEAVLPANNGSTNTATGSGVGREFPVGKLGAWALGSRELLLVAGEQVRVVPQGATKQPAPDVLAATAWSQGRIVFHGTPLKDVVAEFNRYNTRQLVIRDAELLTFKVTGIFSSTDPMSLIRFFEARPEMNVKETSDEIIISTRRASSAASHQEP